MPGADDAVFVKITTIDNLIEAQIIESMLLEQKIPHRIRSFHDTAYDGLFQFQKGYGEIFAPEPFRSEILSVVDHVKKTDLHNQSEQKNEKGGSP